MRFSSVYEQLLLQKLKRSPAKRNGEASSTARGMRLVANPRIILLANKHSRRYAGELHSKHFGTFLYDLVYRLHTYLCLLVPPPHRAPYQLWHSFIVRAKPHLVPYPPLLCLSPLALLEVHRLE